ncbi:PREDICTED: uncharacterized protein LOC104804825 [Tarenaya hassleriana]|uniref:uncharacterized protein LOC104804825 n=1 Tax=Tarenaya hassleriana TaxID=28532 RepID=UPI00053C0C69|nr:PREDICTED: uncharacterized protein LOC104804825 [Tarenaya hassleriana]
MEILTRILDRSATEGRLSLHYRCINPMITHLSFADDVMIFTQGDLSSLSEVRRILTEFGVISGLRINPDKSELFLARLSDGEKRSISADLGIGLELLPVRYLGVPLSPSRLTKAPLLQRIRAKLDGWTTKFLSAVGKIQLVTSVIFERAREFTRIQLGDGGDTSFWYDSWLEIGPQIEFIGIAGPRLLRLPKTARVKDAVHKGRWLIRGARNERVQQLQTILSSMDPPRPDNGTDQPLWRKNDDNYHPTFVSRLTWDRIRTPAAPVSWFGLVWFSTKDYRLRIELLVGVSKGRADAYYAVRKLKPYLTYSSVVNIVRMCGSPLQKILAALPLKRLRMLERGLTNIEWQSNRRQS